MATDVVALPVLEGAPAGLNSPPDSNPALKDPNSDSDLSDLEPDQAEQMFMSDSPPVPKVDAKFVPKHEATDVLDIQPIDIQGGVPIFKPSMEEFSDFIRFMNSINHYGMKSGIVKVIPPKEWVDAQPPLDDAVKTINIRDPISQDFQKGAAAGEYRQINMDHRKSYNLPQWRKFCEMRDAPKPRGQRNQTQAKSTATTESRKKSGKKSKASKNDATDSPRPMTPMSPAAANDDDGGEDARPVGRMGGGRQAPTVGASISARRKHGRRATGAIDHAAFEGFDYKLNEEFNDKRCDDLEVQYWRSLMNAPPLYGADMMGSLFDDRTKLWNLGKLKNILDVLGEEIPGVNTAYLYLGSWKATFAWHLEDVDLYSINYLHFGAPKQWYSIAQNDVPRFEAAMSKAFPESSKSCTQFLRHKTFLISPSRLQAVSGVKVNKIVHRPGEFVITFPYGYHSGYNLGYNCAEAVNFALESWLDIGMKAEICDCPEKQDPVFIDVRKLKKKLGYEVEPSEDEYESYDEEDYESGDEPTDLPTPPHDRGEVKIKLPTKKRKRPVHDKDSGARRIRIKLNHATREPCVLCPNDIPSEPLLPTDTGKQAHKICARYIPETDIESGAKEIVTNISRIDKARQELKCFYCKRKKGACFQCSQKKCHRAYHATCAAAAGVFVEEGWTPIFAEDGTEYKKWDIEFSCRFHRPKRDKKYDGEALGEDRRLLKAAAQLKKDDVVQAQFWNADIWAGVVLENRRDEETVLLKILPGCVGEPVEVEYKWLLLPNPADSRLQKPSPDAKEMPKELSDDNSSMSKRQTDDLPRADDPFVKGCTWAEFNRYVVPRNPAQVKIDFSKKDQIWYYLGKTSTEAKAQFTEDPRKPRDNRAGHFLDTIPKASAAHSRPSYAATYPSKLQHSTLASPATRSPHAQSLVPQKPNKEYTYKPRTSATPTPSPQYHPQPQYSSARPAGSSYPFGTDPRWQQGQQGAQTPNRWQSGASPVANHQQETNSRYQPASNNTSSIRPPPQMQNAPKWIPPSARWHPGATTQTPDQEALNQFLADSDALSYRPVIKRPFQNDEGRWQPGTTIPPPPRPASTSSSIPPPPRPVTTPRPASQGYNVNPPSNGQYDSQYPNRYHGSPIGTGNRASSSPQPQIYHSHSIPKSTVIHTLPQPPPTASGKSQERLTPGVQHSNAPKYPTASHPTQSQATKPVPKFTPPSRPILPPNSSKPILPPSSSKPILPPNSSKPILPPSSGKPILPPKSTNRSYQASSPFAKYKYLQLEHNRSAMDYKSPYRPGPEFGFMNGYQGQLLSVEQLMATSSQSGLHPAIRQKYFVPPPSKSNSVLQPPSLYGGLAPPSHMPATTYNPMYSAMSNQPGYGSHLSRMPSRDEQEQMSNQRMAHDFQRYQPLNGAVTSGSHSSSRSSPHIQPSPQSYSAAHPAVYSGKKTVTEKPLAATLPVNTSSPRTSSSTPQKLDYYPPILPQKRQPTPQSQKVPPVSQSEAKLQENVNPLDSTPEASKSSYPSAYHHQSPQEPINSAQLYLSQQPIVPDVPIDTTSLIEKMLSNLRKA